MEALNGVDKNNTQTSLAKYQGILLKKQKIVGFKRYVIVLNRGQLIYYSNE